MYGMNVVTLAFAGHLGDLELAAISIASTVVVGLNFGLFVSCQDTYLHFLSIFLSCWGPFHSS
jgi:MATE family multidrug resistance protein